MYFGCNTAHNAMHVSLMTVHNVDLSTWKLNNRECFNCCCLTLKQLWLYLWVSWSKKPQSQCQPLCRWDCWSFSTEVCSCLEQWTYRYIQSMFSFSTKLSNLLFVILMYQKCDSGSCKHASCNLQKIMVSPLLTVFLKKLSGPKCFCGTSYVVFSAIHREQWKEDSAWCNCPCQGVQDKDLRCVTDTDATQQTVKKQRKTHERGASLYQRPVTHHHLDTRHIVNLP